MANDETKDITPILSGPRGLSLTSLEDMFRFAQYVVASGFAPKGMEKPASILIAVQIGQEVGLAPMQAVQGIAVINGRPTIYGDTAKALVEASGMCVGFSETFSGEGDKLTARCEINRAGRAPVVQTFSVEDAKRAKLWGKEGPWTFYPRRMLQLRARGFAIRDAFPDVIKGLATTEDVIDYDRLERQRDSIPTSADEIIENAKAEVVTPSTPRDILIAEIVKILRERKIGVNQHFGKLGYSSITDVPDAKLEAELNKLQSPDPHEDPPFEPETPDGPPENTDAEKARLLEAVKAAVKKAGKKLTGDMFDLMLDNATMGPTVQPEKMNVQELTALLKAVEGVK